MSSLKPWLYGLVGALALALPLRLGWLHHSEDFIYEYGACRLYLQGQNPYDTAAYQGELRAIAGAPNPFITSSYASAYPPAFFLTAAPICRLPLREAFAAWNLALYLSLILLWLCAAGLLKIAPSALEFPLLAAGLALFPGLFESLFYHRSAVAVVALFAAGLALWDRGKEVPAALVFGFLAQTPQWFAYVLAALVLGKKYRAACAACWLAVLQGIPYLLGIHPWTEAPGYLASLSYHSSALAFSDDQSLGVALYKIGRLVAGRGEALKPFFEPSRGFLVLRKALFLLSWAALWRLARTTKGLTAGRLSWVTVPALLGSIYSHDGDQMWIIPALIFWLKTRRENSGVAPRAPLLALCALDLLSLPIHEGFVPHQRFFEGFWSLEYLGLAALCDLRFGGLPGACAPPLHSRAATAARSTDF